jgi:hypothetical protein
MMHFSSIIRVLLIIMLCSSSAKINQSKLLSSKGSIPPDREGDPFEQFAQFLIRSSKKGDELGKYSSDEIRRTVKKLAAGQEALKSMDGAAHQLRSTFSDR